MSDFFTSILAAAEDTVEREDEAGAEQPAQEAGAAEEQQVIGVKFQVNDGLPGAIISDVLDEEDDSPLMGEKDIWTGLRPTPEAPAGEQAQQGGDGEASGEAAQEVTTPEAGAGEGSEEAPAGAGGDGEAEAGADGVSIAPVLGALGQLAGHHFETPEAFAEHYEQVIDEREAFQGLRQLLEGSPEANKFVAALLEGKDPNAAAVEAIAGLTTEVPEDPDDAAAYWKRVGEEQAQAKISTQQAGVNKQKRDRIADKARRSFTATAQQLGLTEEQQKDFLHEASIIQAGDLERGTLRPDTYLVLYRGLNHEQLVEKAKKEAFEMGVQQGLKSSKAAKRGQAPPLPTLTGGSGKRAEGTRPRQPQDRALAVVDSLAGPTTGKSIHSRF